LNTDDEQVHPRRHLASSWGRRCKKYDFLGQIVHGSLRRTEVDFSGSPGLDCRVGSRIVHDVEEPDFAGFEKEKVRQFALCEFGRIGGILKATQMARWASIPQTKVLHSASQWLRRGCS